MPQARGVLDDEVLCDRPGLRTGTGCPTLKCSSLPGLDHGYSSPARSEAALIAIKAHFDENGSCPLVGGEQFRIEGAQADSEGLDHDFTIETQP